MIDLRPIDDEIRSLCDLSNLNARRIYWRVDSSRITFAVVVQNDRYSKDVLSSLAWWYLDRCRSQDSMPLSNLAYYRMQPNDGLGLIYRTSLFLVLVYRQALKDNIGGVLSYECSTKYNNG